MAAPSRLAVGLTLTAGALILGACVPLSEIIVFQAMESGGLLAGLAFLTLFAATGAGLLLYGWHLARERRRRLL